MKVRVQDGCTGYYGNKRRKQGEVFVLVPLQRVGKDGKKITIPPEKQFSDKWMVLEETPIAPPKKLDGTAKSNKGNPTFEATPSADQQVI